MEKLVKHMYSEMLNADKKAFEYNWNGRLHKYLPDFYLIDTNEYVEIKGIETERDIAKWSQFPKKLKVLKRKDLRLLGLKV